MSIIWDDNRPMNTEPACKSVVQDYDNTWYSDFHVVQIDPDNTWDAFSWIKDRLGVYTTNGGEWAARVPLGETKMFFYIKNADEAVLFKLTWA